MMETRSAVLRPSPASSACAQNTSTNRVRGEVADRVQTEGGYSIHKKVGVWGFGGGGTCSAVMCAPTVSELSDAKYRPKLMTCTLRFASVVVLLMVIPGGKRVHRT